jgi:asparagine synthase (glutamine-hydrolysing)
MCGICGILNFDKADQVNESNLIEMRDLITHRGPNDYGIYLKGNIGLAHRRLSIIDLGGGHQPMSNEDGTVWIVFNGEIYNYRELMSYLSAKGHIFKTRCDTEVIVHAYEEFGMDCLEKLRGMFAFAIWDEAKRKLLLARDRLGEKPLYYCKLNDGFIFSSEIKTILLDPRVRRKLSEVALSYYLRLRYVPGPYTMFENIFKLQAGHHILIREKEPVIRRFWDLSSIRKRDERPAQPEEIEDEFLSMLEECIRARLMSEVPLGVFLSGGIDSSVVVALMRKVANTEVKTFCVGSEEEFGVNEFDYARMVAQKYGTDHHEFSISGRKFYDFIPKYVWHMDEPVSDPAAIPLFYLSQFSKQYVTVVLSGEGADEILAGYYIYKKMLFMEKFRAVAPEFVRENIILKLISFFINTEKQRNYVDLVHLPIQRRYKGVGRVFTPQGLEMLYGHADRFVESLDSHYASIFEEVSDREPLDKMLYVDIKTWLPDDLLMKADKMTMANSQELRVPFLDHKLVEFAFALPSQFKIRKNTTKYLLRKVANELVPDAIIKREKKGFFTPISRWFRGDLNQFAKEVLLDSSSACNSYFDKSYISFLLDNHKEGLSDFSENIWNLLVFEYWYEKFIKNNPVQKVVS